MKLRKFAPVVFFFILFVGFPEAGIASSEQDCDQHSQYYELRMYTLSSATQLEQVDAYWGAAAIPAFNRMGIARIGVFTEFESSEPGHVFVLIPYESTEQFIDVSARLSGDEEYQSLAAEYLNAPKDSPAFETYESSLLRAFDGMKQMEIQPQSHVFELRKYISASENKGLNKIQMFEDGEIALMKEVGLAPVFFSQTLIGTRMPNLVYMTSGENLEAHKQHWGAFSDSPVWQALKADLKYKDNMNGMEKYLLKRTAASQM